MEVGYCWVFWSFTLYQTRGWYVVSGGGYILGLHASDDYIILDDEKLTFSIVFFYMKTVGYYGLVVGFGGVVVRGGWVFLWKWFGG